MSALILGHKNPDSDSIISAIACAHLYKLRGLDVVPAAQGTPAPETAFILERFGLEAPEVVTSVAGRDIYLVDFSDKAQAPCDIDQANLKGIVDHHKLGDVTSTAPVECIIWTAGCTNTILKRMYDYCGFEIPANLAGAMLCAILSDTVIFKSPTTTDMDRRAAEELAAQELAEQQAAEQAQAEQQIKEAGLQQQAALEQAKMEQEDRLNQRDNETKIIVASMAHSADDGIQEPEYSQEAKDKLAESIRQFDERLKLDKERLNLDKHKAEVDADLKRKALNKKTTTSSK